MKQLLTTAAIVLLSCASTPVYAGATVFVPAEKSYAWSVRELQFLPKKTSDEGVTIKQIDAWISAHRGMKSASTICYMDFARDNEIVSSDRTTQSEIDRDLRAYPNSFSQWYEPEQASKFLVRVGIFEMCQEAGSKEEPIGFMAVLVTDQQGQIKEFDALDWNYIRLVKGDSGRINLLGCYACGEIRELVWDKFNDKFYYEWVGH